MLEKQRAEVGERLRLIGEVLASRDPGPPAAPA